MNLHFINILRHDLIPFFTMWSASNIKLVLRMAYINVNKLKLNYLNFRGDTALNCNISNVIVRFEESWLYWSAQNRNSARDVQKQETLLGKDATRKIDRLHICWRSVVLSLVTTLYFFYGFLLNDLQPINYMKWKYNKSIFIMRKLLQKHLTIVSFHFHQVGKTRIKINFG